MSPTADTTASPLVDGSMPLGIAGFKYADLYDPARLHDLLGEFDRWFSPRAPRTTRASPPTATAWARG